MWKDFLERIRKNFPIRRGMLREVHRKRSRKEIEELLEEIPKFRVHEPEHLIVIPPTDDIRNVNVQYPLLEPYAYAHIKWSDAEGELIYRVVEPKLNEKEKRIYQKVVNALVELVDVQLSTIKNPNQAMEYVEEKIKEILSEMEIDLSRTEFSKIMYYIYRNFVGLNRIEPLMHDSYIEDISCDGIEVPVYVVHKRFGSLQTNIVYRDEEELRDFVVKLAERAGRYISYAEPLLDGSLPDGTRVQATLAKDVTTRGPTFSLRKFTEEPFSPVDLIKLGTASSEMMAYLWFLIENGVSLLICGGVATGKTSLLNAISLFIPPEAKIISIEDTRELNLPHDNWIPAVARLGFGTPTAAGTKYGEVRMFDLLKDSFRQNPDYVIIGEVRGEEAYVMFQGMASGHPSMGTMHARGVKTVIKRLQTPPIQLPPALVEILDIVITMTHAREKGKSARRIESITEIVSVDPDTGDAKTNVVFEWLPREDKFVRGKGNWVLQKISRGKGIRMSEIKKELENREKVLEWLLKKGVTDWKSVAEIVGEYHRNPQSVMKRIGVRTSKKTSKKTKKSTASKKPKVHKSRKR